MLNSRANKFLFDLIFKKPVYIIACLSLSLICTIFDVLGTVLFIPAIAILLSSTKSIIISEYPTPVGYLYGLFADYDLKTGFLKIAIIIFFAFAIKILANYVYTVLELKHTKSLISSMQNAGIDLLCRVNLNYFQQIQTKDILFELNRGFCLASLCGKYLFRMLIIAIKILMLVVILLLISWQLTFISLSILWLIISIDKRLISSTKNLRSLTTEKSQTSTYRIVEFLTGIRSIKTAANESAAKRAIARSLSSKNQALFVAQVLSAATKPIHQFSRLVMFLILAIACYYLYSSVTEFASVVSLYLIVLFKMLPLFGKINRARLQFKQTKPSAEAVANFLNPATKQFSHSGDTVFSELQTGIEFKAVTFAYPQHARIILDKLSFSIPQGTTTVLFGLNKSGKSTVADLLIRFYDPIEGKILLDGIELQQYQLSSLRKATSVISRNTFLFDDSLANNIAYGLNNVSQADIIDAVKKAHIEEFVSQLPQGLATRIGRQGVTISEAQRLRIAIAKAFLRDPEILILDDAIDLNDNSQMAEESIEIIEALCRDRTTLIITSQLNLARNADRIVVLDQGKIVERGTHQQLLLKQDGIYQRLYSTQFKTSLQSRQLKLAQRISQKLARHTETNHNFASEIKTNLNTLLDRLQLIDEGVFEDELEQNRILDESYQSAKSMLISLREYEQKISRGLNDSDRTS